MTVAKEERFPQEGAALAAVLPKIDVKVRFLCKKLSFLPQNCSFLWLNGLVGCKVDLSQFSHKSRSLS